MAYEVLFILKSGNQAIQHFNSPYDAVEQFKKSKSALFMIIAKEETE